MVNMKEGPGNRQGEHAPAGQVLGQVEIERRKKQIVEDPIKKDRLNSFLGDILQRGAKALDMEFARALDSTDKDRFEQFLTMLLLARESDEVDGAVVNEFISTLENKVREKTTNRDTFLQYKKYLENI
ncbi:MAG: hypothetical protein WCT29_03560 [Candidatus Paceibacterota bacterium]